MARANFKLPEEFLLKVSKLENRTDDLLPKVLQAGAEVVESKVRVNLSSVIGKNTKMKSRSTGELVKSLGISRALQDKHGDWNVKVGFSEPRSDGNANAKIANILEYGRHGQPPKPFLKPAKSKSKKECIETMKNTLNKEIEQL